MTINIVPLVLRNITHFPDKTAHSLSVSTIMHMPYLHTSTSCTYHMFSVPDKDRNGPSTFRNPIRLEQMKVTILIRVLHNLFGHLKM
jgi:hypothetical protein